MCLSVFVCVYDIVFVCVCVCACSLYDCSCACTIYSTIYSTRYGHYGRLESCVQDNSFVNCECFDTCISA